MEVQCDLTAPAVVRKALARMEAVQPVLDDATLIASELVTNAVIHSGCTAGDAIEVSVAKGAGRLEISVRDPGASGKQAALAEGDMTGYGGFGLRVVEAVASRWGAERADGYRVWAQLPLAGGDRSLTGT